jgi:hypothetical protein
MINVFLSQHPEELRKCAMTITERPLRAWSSDVTCTDLVRARFPVVRLVFLRFVHAHHLGLR